MLFRSIDYLLKLIAKGDNSAFERLYIETKHGVYAFLFSFFNNSSDCEDAMQTVYLKVKTNISQYKVGSNGLAWILQIAKHTALNEIRAMNNRQKLCCRDEYSQADAFVNVAIKDTLLTIMKRVLDEEEQRIIILHVIWAYKHKEIAAILNSPIGTITSKYKRAVDKLKTALKEEKL